MSTRVPVIAIFDIGKTNKKLLLFDECYQIVYEESKTFDETKDEDGFACEDIFALNAWIRNSFDQLLNDERFEIKAINFSAYGASFVYLDKQLRIAAPLYNYLKPCSPQIQKSFYNKYGGEKQFSKSTASPVLGNLNSGMQLFGLKYEKPELFEKIKYALHLPQYLSFVFCSSLHSEMTSIGCHTNLWDFEKNKYHQWVTEEGVAEKLPPIISSDCIACYAAKIIPVGAGLHDSSAALIPYFSFCKEPFLLLSTGTWCISLNPFNHSTLTEDELEQDCLCYLSYSGMQVKASRLFAGHEHEEQTKRIAEHFNRPDNFFRNIQFDIELLNNPMKVSKNAGSRSGISSFQERNLNDFKNHEEAYYQLIFDLAEQQVRSTNLVLKNSKVKKIFVDGGFSQNNIYMQLLAEAFPEIEIYAATVAQASALGAALVVHRHWNGRAISSEIIHLKYYPKLLH